MRKNVAGQTVAFQMVSAADGSDITSGTPAVYYTIDGGTQGTGAGTSTHEGNGQWSYVPAQAETNGDHVAFTMVLSGAISQTVNVYPVSYDPTDADGLGLSRIDAAVSTRGTADPGDEMTLSDGAITANKIASGALTAAKFAAGAFDAVWTVTTRLLTAGTNIVLAKGTGLTGLNDLSAAQVNAEADTALSDAGVTSTRLGYVDNLNVGGNVASSAEVTSIQNNTRVVRVVPQVIERPDSGTATWRIELFCYDTTGSMEAPDSAPTVALVNQAGTDRSSRLDSATGTLVETGRYRWVYTADDEDALEQLVWTFTVVEGSVTRKYGNQSVIVDTTAVDFTAADRSKLDTIHGKLPTADFLPGVPNADGSGLATAAAQSAAQADLDTLTDVGVALATSQPNYAPAKAGDEMTLSDGAITANKIASGALTAAKFAAGAFDAVWTVTTRLLTAGTNIVLAKGTGLTGLNDIPASAVRTDMDANSTQLAKLGTIYADMTEDDGGTRRFTGNALELAPSGSGASVSAIADAVCDELLAGHTTPGSLARAISDILSDLSDGGRLDLLIDAIKLETDKLGSAVPDSIPSDGSRPTPIQALYMVVQFLLERSVSGTTITVKKPDGSTLFTLTSDDATSPTTITRSS